MGQTVDELTERIKSAESHIRELKCPFFSTLEAAEEAIGTLAQQMSSKSAIP